MSHVFSETASGRIQAILSSTNPGLRDGCSFFEGLIKYFKIRSSDFSCFNIELYFKVGINLFLFSCIASKNFSLFTIQSILFWISFLLKVVCFPTLRWRTYSIEQLGRECLFFLLSYHLPVCFKKYTCPNFNQLYFFMKVPPGSCLLSNCHSFSHNTDQRSWGFRDIPGVTRGF